MSEADFTPVHPVPSPVYMISDAYQGLVIRKLAWHEGSVPNELRSEKDVKG